MALFITQQRRHFSAGRQAERYLQNHFADCLFPKEDPRSILQKKVIVVPVNGVNH